MSFIWKIPAAAQKCIDYYTRNIRTAEYLSHKTEEENRRKKTHDEYVSEMHPEWKHRVDYFEKSCIAKVMFWDVLSNEGISKLLKKLHSLPSDRFAVKNYYKKPSIKNQYDYVELQYSHSSYGIFAEIKLLQDIYIDTIEVSWTQINNYFAFMEYTFHLKKCLTEELYLEFILDNIRNFTKHDYLIYYPAINSISNTNHNYDLIDELHVKYFPLICQHYITSLLYSEQGRENLLVHMIFQVREQTINIDNMYLGDITTSFYNKKENYIITRDIHGEEYTLFSGKNRIPNFSAGRYIASYRNDFYYRFFGNRELRIFEREFSKFSTGRKKITYNKNLKLLLNRMQGLADFDNISQNLSTSHFSETWDFYVSNAQEDFDSYFGSKTDEFRKIYQNHFTYLKLLTDLNYTKSNRTIAIIAAITSVVAAVVSAITLFA